MQPVSIQQFLSTVRHLDGKVLRTVSGREFTIRTYLNYPYFVPASSGKGRSEGRRGLQRFLSLYNSIGSLRPADYAAVSRDASYYIPVLVWHLKHAAGCESEHSYRSKQLDTPSSGSRSQ